MVHAVSLNEHAAAYFEILNFKEPILLTGRNKSDYSKPVSSVFRLKFNQTKFIQHNSGARSGLMNQPAVNIHTNFTSFPVPLYIYDGQLAIVSLKFDFIYLNNADK